MNDYPLSLSEIVGWLRSAAHSLAESESGVTLTDVHERDEHLPAASADFDAPRTIGRVSAWVTGYFDFEVLDREDGAQVVVLHRAVLTIDDPGLQDAYSQFLDGMCSRGPVSIGSPIRRAGRPLRLPPAEPCAPEPMRVRP